MLYKQPSGLDARADNKENLKPGYYENMLKGHTQEWINVYVKGEYGSVHGDRVVYTEYDDEMHLSPVPLKANPNLPIYLGFDYGLTPAMVIAQLQDHGQKLVVLREILATTIAPDGMGIKQFIRGPGKEALQEFSRHIVHPWGDPSGNRRADTDEKTVELILQEEGIPVQGCHTNNFIARREAVADYLGGNRRFLLDPSCKVLRRGFMKGYRYKRVRVDGEDRWADVVDKIGNHFTHPHDALQYICLGIKGQTRKNRLQRLLQQGMHARPRAPLYREEAG